jgi:hypothetical protein
VRQLYQPIPNHLVGHPVSAWPTAIADVNLVSTHPAIRPFAVCVVVTNHADLKPFRCVPAFGVRHPLCFVHLSNPFSLLLKYLIIEALAARSNFKSGGIGVV